MKVRVIGFYCRRCKQIMQTEKIPCMCGALKFKPLEAKRIGIANEEHPESTFDKKKHSAIVKAHWTPAYIKVDP